MAEPRSSPGSSRGFALLLAGNSLLRLTSVALRALLTLAMAVWLQPSELGVYAIVAATLTLTTYFYGLDFQTFSMRELSTSDLAGARLRVRDQFSLLLIIYALGSAALAAVLTQFAIEPKLVALVVPMAVLQHASLEFYRIFNRLGRPVAGTIILLIRDAAWAPLCIAAKLLTGELSLATLLAFWLAGSAASALYGAILLIRWLPASERRPVDLAWLASGLRSGLKMLVGTLSVVALFTIDRMIFAKLNTPDELGAYALFALGCASLQGLFESAILPSYWAPLLQAKNDCDPVAYRRAQQNLGRACLAGGVAVGVLSVAGLTILTWFLPNPTYAENLRLLYLIAAAYSLLTLTNISHYRLFAERRDSLIVIANLAGFVGFLLLVPFLVNVDRSTAVPLALALACGSILTIKTAMAGFATFPVKA